MYLQIQYKGWKQDTQNIGKQINDQAQDGMQNPPSTPASFSIFPRNIENCGGKNVKEAFKEFFI